MVDMSKDYHALYDALNTAQANAATRLWLEQLPLLIQRAFQPEHHGDAAHWQHSVAHLPNLVPTQRNITTATITIGLAAGLTPTEQQALTDSLKALHPWRKGAYTLYGIHIDTEWRSDWKWTRLQAHIAPLNYRKVLDVGCGNGYHCWRMLGADAALVIGIDPTLLNVMQFHAIKKLYHDPSAPIYVVPCTLEDLPPALTLFDTVFSMGVLYHRRSPIDHLLALKDCMVAGGELILETLVIEGREGEVLLPEQRYASMRNVWFLPSCDTLKSWLKRCGFINIRLIDVALTSTEEQRSTEWMQFHSLQDFLEPSNPLLTKEGLPAPRRAMFIANRP